MTLDPTKLPQHIGIIMDGNGRWAQRRLMPRSAGHRAGVKTLERVMEAVFELGIPYFTVYAFSTENKERPNEEINGLFDLIRDYFKKKLPTFVEKKVSIRILGDKSYFPKELQDVLASAEQQTAAFKDKTFITALNYGSRLEIVRAVNRAVENGKSVTEQTFGILLDTNGLPDPDLILRTGGETRLSNFLLYQAAYAELFFVPDLWPDFNKKRLYKVLEEYGRRARRFGKVT